MKFGKPDAKKTHEYEIFPEISSLEIFRFSNGVFKVVRINGRKFLSKGGSKTDKTKKVDTEVYYYSYYYY